MNPLRALAARLPSAAAYRREVAALVSPQFHRCETLAYSVSPHSGRAAVEPLDGSGRRVFDNEAAAVAFIRAARRSPWRVGRALRRDGAGRIIMSQAFPLYAGVPA